MIVLNSVDVARNAAKAYVERKLSAQGTMPYCAYRDDLNRPCVIGASLDNKTAHKWDKFEEQSIECIYTDGAFETDDIEYLQALQGAHDNWAQSVDRGIDANPIGYEVYFVGILNQGLPEGEKIKVNGDGGTVV